MKDLFTQINNAVLDLQSSQLQSFERPLKTLAKLLRHTDLETVNTELTAGIDLQAFLDEHAKETGGMLGSDSVDWPTETREYLGVVLLLIEKFASDPDYMMNFGHRFFYSDNKYMSGINAITGQVIIPFARDYKSYVMSAGEAPRLVIQPSNEIFIVHGRAESPREAVARFIEQLGLKAIILNERANRGMTLIEKVEAHSNVGFAVVLLTPDDLGHLVGEAVQPRARQNVILELGYFVGKLGRARVCALQQGDLEIPSDWRGIVDEVFDGKGAWKQRLAKELEAAGYVVDWNVVMKAA